MKKYFKIVIMLLIFIHGSPLCAHSNIQMIEPTFESFLVEYHSSMQCRNQGCPPLLYAVRKEYFEICKRLLERGEDPNECDKRSKRTPLIEAIELENYEIFELLISYKVDLNYENPMVFSARKNDSYFSQRLLELGSFVTEDAFTAAAKPGGSSVETFNIILESVIDQRIPNILSSLNALSAAAELEVEEDKAVQYFKLKRLFEIGFVPQGFIPRLNSAIKFAWIDGLELLLENGANSNSINRRGILFSKLFYRVKETGKVLDSLIKYGYDINSTKEILLSGSNPLYSQFYSRNVRVPIITFFLVEQNYDMLELFHSKGANIEDLDSTGYTPLIEAVLARDIVGVRKLLALGADPWNKGNEKKLPIDYAVLDRNNDMINLLAKYMAL